MQFNDEVNTLQNFILHGISAVRIDSKMNFYFKLKNDVKCILTMSFFPSGLTVSCKPGDCEVDFDFIATLVRIIKLVLDRAIVSASIL